MYDIVLIEKPLTDGLSREEILELSTRIKEDSIYPIEIQGKTCESIAMGFITEKASCSLDYNYEDGLTEYIGSILCDVTKETPNGEYSFRGLSILLVRDLPKRTLDLVLSVSTANISCATGDWLDEEECDGLIVYVKQDAGWWIYTSYINNPEESIPAELMALINYCRERGIAWLCLDRDAELLPGFPKY